MNNMTENTTDNKPIQKSVSPEKINAGIKSLSRLFFFGGGLLIIFSLFHFYDLFLNSYTPIKLLNPSINFVFGIGNIICGYLLRKRKAVLIVLYGCLLIINIIISILCKNYFFIFSMIIGFCFLCYFFTLKQKGVLK